MFDTPVSTSLRHNGRGHDEENSSPLDWLNPLDTFPRRHVGPHAEDIAAMLSIIGVDSLEALIDATIPASIRLQHPLDLPPAQTEAAVLQSLRHLAQRNQVYRSFIGLGYHAPITPPVILRNILENPGWYTQYTPYQPEISQGRLEALLNFQTMITDLTGLDIANASLLDEATAAAEAMVLALHAQKRPPASPVFFVSDRCHPQTIEVVRTRAKALNIQVVVGDHAAYDVSNQPFGVLVQYPTTDGAVLDYNDFFAQAHRVGAVAIVAADLLALTLLRPPGEFGADVAVGNSQRFGVPLGFGGPHAAYMATRDAYKRLLPGRLVGVSVDAAGGRALRLALQTREQHIRRDRATSNICTAQVLLAIMASMYAVYHGPHGLKRIAQRVRFLTAILAAGLRQAGYTLTDEPIFDTVKVTAGPLPADQLLARANDRGINLRPYPDGGVGIALDEPTTVTEIEQLLTIFNVDPALSVHDLAQQVQPEYPASLQRTSPYLTHPVFNTHHSETEMLRYITRLESRDLSLAHSMIPLGSCTMKLNATTEMIPVTWPEFAHLHPFAPAGQSQGYRLLFDRLGQWLQEITGFAGVSFQPNAGSQGEYTGLLVIRAYHEARGEAHRTVCLIPSSAHGTNPASAVMAGLEVVVVRCDDHGNVDIEDLRAKAAQYASSLAALMITYPSTHGVFEENIAEICAIVHTYGGQVYLDGANMNALVGLCRPAAFGADVCHLNLHKTFCIPHGGGGPGMGPICVAEHLTPFLPRHPLEPAVGGAQGIGPVAAAPWGSPAILTIPYAYIAMMGAEGLTQATQVAILNANYIAARLNPHFPVLYTGAHGHVAHECIIDLRALKESAGILPDDVAKRLMDFGFHAPTMSWPVAGTLMIEPTESESLDELDRFCDAMIAIRDEIRAIERGEFDHQDNPLKNAPHTASMATASEWTHPYSREQAAFPTTWVRQAKFWPFVARIDNVYGDRNLICTCPPVEAYL